MLTAQQVARAALPAAPTGWVIGGYEAELSTRDSICRDVRGHALGLQRLAHHQPAPTMQAEREQAMADAGVRARAAQAARQPRIDALTAQGEKLGAELGAAVQKGTRRASRPSTARWTRSLRRCRRSTSGAEDQAIRESLAKVMTQDRTMQVAVSINAGGHLESGASGRLPRPARIRRIAGRRRPTACARPCARALRQLAAGVTAAARGATARHRLPRRRACDRGPRGTPIPRGRLADGLDRLRRARGIVAR